MKEFTSLLLDINNMFKEYKLFNFLIGLKPSTQIKIRRQVPKNLPTAIGYVEAFVDYQEASTSDVEKKLPRSKERKSVRRRDLSRKDYTRKAPDIEKTREDKVETRPEF